MNRRTVTARSPWAGDPTDPDWRPSLPEWQTRALCRELDPELFFEEGPGAGGIARRACELCQVTGDCLEWALSLPPGDDQHGILGGVGPRKRREMRRQRQQSAAEVAA